VRASSHPRRNRLKSIIGWREFIGLPDLDIPQLRAKIDTGARTSALHAVDISVSEDGEARWVEFHVPLPGRPRHQRSRALIVDDRLIKNTSGIAEHRYVVETTLVLGARHWRIEVSLADRENMGFDIILGRTAIRTHGLLVNPGSSYLAGLPVQRASISSEPRHKSRSEKLPRGEFSPHISLVKGDEL